MLDIFMEHKQYRNNAANGQVRQWRMTAHRRMNDVDGLRREKWAGVKNSSDAQRC